MVGLLELYEGYLNKPTCESIGNIRIGRDGRGYRKLTNKDIPIEWLHYAKKKGIPIKKKTLVIGEELDPIDTGCGPLLNAFIPQTSTGEWCCTPSIAQYTTNGSRSPIQTCASEGTNYYANMPYFGIALLNSSGSLVLLMDTSGGIASATPGWSKQSVTGPTLLCGSSQYNGYAYISFVATPSQQFSITTAQFLIGTATLANNGLFSTAIEWQNLSYTTTAGSPFTINIYLGVS